MTAWEFARLGAGQYGLPGPALVVSRWVLDVRLARCPTPGFRRVVAERSWAKLGTRQSVYADFSDPGYVWVYRTDNPDHESLHRDYSGGADDWDRMSTVDWWGCVAVRHAVLTAVLRQRPHAGKRDRDERGSPGQIVAGIGWVGHTRTCMLIRACRVPAFNL